ncbi:MAG: class I SAM-dependent methyltransferase [Caldisphaera sp.]
MMIDRSLNYGRHIIENFAKKIRNNRETCDGILDIGAGQGSDLMIFKKYFQYAKLMALEYHESNILTLLNKGIKTFKCDIERDRFPFDDESVDIIIANQILEHTKEIFWIFHEITRVLKTNGYFIIGIPNLASLHNRLLLLAGRQPTCIKNKSAHVRGFTKYDMIDLLNLWGGYKLIDFKGSNFYPFPPFVAKLLASLLPSMSVSIFFLLEKTEKYNDAFIRYPIENKLETNFFIGQRRS